MHFFTELMLIYLLSNVLPKNYISIADIFLFLKQLNPLIVLNLPLGTIWSLRVRFNLFPELCV